MKKMVMGTVSAALVLSLAVTGAFAAGNGRGRNYVDANGDGVCDNYGTGRGQYFVDANGDGVCDNCGTGRGQYFVDADGDGVCDNCGTGRGQYFVDADGDGVCDNCTQQGLCPRDGSGRQNGWGRGR
ncbi:hypothetical protein [Agathobaculum sp. Marseille-P7918]|uniref:hypothetical protein n=1 Tax=Agathobaculum sp. Marseille-P7918 TaxID=2479843 RepID=UPI000F63D5E7|nr:hypothetical protein [Agathobaculum sp. Marseille-P7918]